MLEQATEEIDRLTTVQKSVLDYRWLATEVYNAGYREQIKGKWQTKYRMVQGRQGLPLLIPTNITFCTVCKKEYGVLDDVSRFKFCPNCGAKMKGGAG